jgi:hypothetical protein
VQKVLVLMELLPMESVLKETEQTASVQSE